MMKTLKGNMFGDVYNILMDYKGTPMELKTRMTEVFPREISKMNGKNVSLAFKHIVDNDFLTEYLWEYHFHLYFWKQSHQLDIKDLGIAVSKMIDIEYFEEPGWFNLEFLPVIDDCFMKCDNFGEVIDLIDALTLLHEKMPEVEVDSYIKKLEERAEFVEKRLPFSREGTFANIVRRDLRYFEEKSKLDIIEARREARETS